MADAIALPPAPNWYGSALASWGGEDGDVYAYAAKNAVILLKPPSSSSADDDASAAVERGVFLDDDDDRPPADRGRRPSSPFSPHPSRVVGALVGHANRVTALAFATLPGARHLLVTGGADKHVRVWDVETRRCVRTMRGHHAAEVSAVATSRASASIAASGDRAGKVFIWRFRECGGYGGGGDRPWRALTPLDASPVLALAFKFADADADTAAAADADADADAAADSGGALAIGHQSGALAVADVDDGSVRKLPARAAEVQSLAWAPPRASGGRGDEKSKDTAVLAVGGRGERAVTLWSWDTKRARASLRGTLPLPKCPSHLSEAQRGRLWLCVAWAGRATIDAPSSSSSEAAAARANANANEKKSDERWLLTSSHGGDVLRWRIDLDADEGRLCVAPPETFGPPESAHARTVFSLAVRESAGGGGGAIATTTSLDKSISSWSVDAATRAWSACGLGGFAYDMDVNPERASQVAIACGDGTVRCLDVEDHASRGRGVVGDGGAVLFRGLPRTKATCVRFRPIDDDDGFGFDDASGSRASANSIAAVGLEDGRIVLVDAMSGRYAIQRDCHAGAVSDVRWITSPRGDVVLVSLGNGCVWRWTSLAVPEDRRRGGGGSGGGGGGGGGDFVDVSEMFDRPPSEAGGGAEIAAFDWLRVRIRTPKVDDDDEDGHDAGDAGEDADAFTTKVAIGWSDGCVTAHAMKKTVDDAAGGGMSFTREWCAFEHARRVTRVRWRARGGGGAAPRANAKRGDAGDETTRAWLGSVGADGAFLVYDGDTGEVVRSAPPCRQALLDLDWAPRGRGGGGGVAAAVAGADGVVRVYDLSGAPVLAAVSRGHVPGKALCVKWARVDGDAAMLVTGGDDQTARAFDPRDPRAAPSAATGGGASSAAETAEGDEKRVAAADAGDGERTAEKEDDDERDEEKSAPAPAPDGGGGGGAATKKKRKGASAGRGLLKPTSFEATAEGVAQSRAAVVALARRIHGGGGVGSIDDAESTECGYGPRGLGLFTGQENAMRTLLAEERAALDADAQTRGGGGGGGDADDDDAFSSRTAASVGAFKPAERAAYAAILRGDFHAAADVVFSRHDGPIPSDFLASLVGGGHAFYATCVAKQIERLERRGEHQRACVLALSLHDVHGALGSLRRGGLPRDAAALAAARLLPTDPALKEALRELAVAEENRGGMEAAAKAHLASGRPSAAVRAMLRPRDALGSVAAAEVALIARVRTEPDKQTVLRAARELSDAGRRDDAEGMLRRWVEGGDGDGDGDADVEEVRRAIVAARRGASGAVEGTEPRAAES